VELLKSALGLFANQIRCSTVEGHKLPVGVNTEAQLRQEVNAAEVVVGLITPSSLASHFVMFELGARWGSNRFLAPLLAGVEAHQLQPPLSLLNALSAQSEQQLHQLLHDIGNRLNLSLQGVASFLSHFRKAMQVANETKKLDIDLASIDASRAENASLVAENESLRQRLAQTSIEALEASQKPFLALALKQIEPNQLTPAPMLGVWIVENQGYGPALNVKGTITDVNGAVTSFSRAAIKTDGVEEFFASINIATAVFTYESLGGIEYKTSSDTNAGAFTFTRA
jgi:hypothetical protein